MLATSDQIAHVLSALEAVPLDRVRLMKTLFLDWHRSGRPADWPFAFEPYLYGPCAFGLYRALEDMARQGLIVQAPHPISQWAPYYLTPTGRRAALAYRDVLPPAHRQQIQDIALWAARQRFHSLLNDVYREAPDFAVRSVLRQPIPPR